MIGSGFAVSAGLIALFFLGEVPRVREDILMNIPVVGSYWERSIAPEDNVSLLPCFAAATCFLSKDGFALCGGYILTNIVPHSPSKRPAVSMGSGESQILILAVDECIFDTWLSGEATRLYRIEATFC